MSSTPSGNGHTSSLRPPTSPPKEQQPYSFAKSGSTTASPTPSSPTAALSSLPNLHVNCTVYESSNYPRPRHIIPNPTVRRNESTKRWSCISESSSTNDKTTGTNSSLSRSSCTTTVYTRPPNKPRS